MTNKTIIKSIKLPKVIEDELISDLQRTGTAFIMGVGRFSVKKFSKKMPLIPDRKGEKVRMILSDNREFCRIGFKPTLTLKKKLSTE